MDRVIFLKRFFSENFSYLENSMFLKFVRVYFFRSAICIFLGCNCRIIGLFILFSIELFIILNKVSIYYFIG